MTNNPSKGIFLVIARLNDGFGSATVQVKSSDHSSNLKPINLKGDSITFTYDELISQGFTEGSDCWVSCDASFQSGVHDSGSNFTLLRDAQFTLVYNLSAPAFKGLDWGGPYSKALVEVSNHGAFTARFRVRSGQHETDLSHAVNAGESCSWFAFELWSYGFLEGEECWLSVDVVAGKTNHESGRNFVMTVSDTAEYSVSGGTLNPSFD